MQLEVAKQQGNFDEIMISTLPRRVSKWLRRDLIRRVEGLGLPVTAIVPGAAKGMGREDIEKAAAQWIVGGPNGCGSQIPLHETRLAEARRR